MKIDKLKYRKTESQSRRKIVSAIELYEKYIDEPIKNINILTSTYYIINDMWKVDIKNNTVSKSYPDPSY